MQGFLEILGKRIPRVIISGTSFDPAYGGPAYSVARLAAALSETGVKVALWAPDGSANTAILPGNESVQRFDGQFDRAVAMFGSPDVVHDNGLWLPHNHRIARFTHDHNIPRVVSPRGMLEPWARRHKRLRKDIAWRLYQRRDLARADMLHATTESEATTLRRVLTQPVSVIPNGVDIPDAGSAKEIDTDETAVKTAVFLGRIYPVKGLPLLVEAWNRVRPAGWRLRIAGPDESNHRSEVDRAVSDAGLRAVVSFLGPVSGENKSKFLNSADLLILPTHSESFGMAVAEALAHGLPVLTTTAAPWPELERVGCGWRVPPSVEGLITGLKAATSQSRQELRRMGAKGRQVVINDYDWSRIARDFSLLYQSVLR